MGSREGHGLVNAAEGALAAAEAGEAVREVITYPVISLPKMLRETTHLRISLVPS